MSLGIKTASGVQRIHSVRVKPTTTAKTITANDTYTAADDNVDGYSSVTVNVPVPPVQIVEVELGELIADTYINSSDGTTAYYSGESATDFIEVDADYYYVFPGDWGKSGGAWDATSNAVYDDNKQYLGGFSFTGTDWLGFTVRSFAATAKYIRLSQATELFTQYKTKVYKIPKSAMPPRGT